MDKFSYNLKASECMSLSIQTKDRIFYLENSTKKMIQFCRMGILPVLVLLAGKMPAPQEILGYFFNWKSLRSFREKFKSQNSAIKTKDEEY